MLGCSGGSYGAAPRDAQRHQPCRDRALPADLLSRSPKADRSHRRSISRRLDRNIPVGSLCGGRHHRTGAARRDRRSRFSVLVRESRCRTASGGSVPDRECGRCPAPSPPGRPRHRSDRGDRGGSVGSEGSGRPTSRARSPCGRVPRGNRRSARRGTRLRSTVGDRTGRRRTDHTTSRPDIGSRPRGPQRGDVATLTLSLIGAGVFGEVRAQVHRAGVGPRRGPSPGPPSPSSSRTSSPETGERTHHETDPAGDPTIDLAVATRYDKRCYVFLGTVTAAALVVRRHT